MTKTAISAPTGSAIDLFDVFVNCPLCGSLDYQLLFAHNESGNVVRCTQCQLKFTRSRWTASWPELRQQHPEPLPDMILQKQDSQIDDFLDILDRIKRYQASGKLLELGCLTGHFLALARKAGYEGVGIEPDPWAAEYARREFGLSVHEALAPNLLFDDRTFDVIAMFHVMEHLTRPMETLLQLHRILKDEGLLAMEIPIVDTLYPMIAGVIGIISSITPCSCPARRLPSSCTKQDLRSCAQSLPVAEFAWNESPGPLPSANTPGPSGDFWNARSRHYTSRNGRCTSMPGTTIEFTAGRPVSADG
jgi:SAM-dependent methyltransferase